MIFSSNQTNFRKKNATTIPFDHKKFVLHFESVFTNDEIAKEFQKFLKSEINEEPWIFLLQVKELKVSKNVVSNTMEIIENHLLETSKYEINISAKVKSTILDDFETQKNNVEWKFHLPPNELFSEITKIVKEEMYHDPWKRFIRTKICEKLIYKYQHDSTVCSPQVTQKFSYTDDYFNHPFVFQQDFNFGQELFKDNFDWEVNGKNFF